MTETRSSAATREHTPRPAAAGTGRGAGRGVGRLGSIRRIPLFLREVVNELRKVIWPTRKELVTYTTVVLVFVSAIIAIVFGLDTAFSKAVLAIFS